MVLSWVLSHLLAQKKANCHIVSYSKERPMKEKWKSSPQLCLTLCDPMDCRLPGSSVHGIFQARVLEWVAISSSRGSSWPRDRTRVSHIVSRHFTVWATREVPWVKKGPWVKELREASSQHPKRNWILPTTTWASLEEELPPVEPSTKPWLTTYCNLMQRLEPEALWKSQVAQQ